MSHLRNKKSTIVLKDVFMKGKYHQFSPVAQLCPTLCDPMNWACQASLSITNSRSSLKLTSIESVMPSSHLILCHPLLLLPPIPPSVRVFSNEVTLHMRWPKYWSFMLAHKMSLSVQFSSVTQSCPTLWDPMNRSTSGLPVHHQLQEFTQTHIHQVSDAIQPSHPLSSPSPPAPSPSQHQSLFQWVNISHEVAKVLEFQLQHHSLFGHC